MIPNDMWKKLTAILIHNAIIAIPYFFIAIQMYDMTNPLSLIGLFVLIAVVHSILIFKLYK
ncbi:MAG: hypothetical protein ACLFUH_08025 [Bacteroidales bacterium]